MASASRLGFWLRLWLKLGLRPRLGLGLGLGWAEAGPGCVAALHYDYSRHMPITGQEGVVMVTLLSHCPLEKWRIVACTLLIY